MSEIKCDCPDWDLGSQRLNAPALTAQARNPGCIPAGYFITFRFCPWCGSNLAAGLSDETTTGEQT